MNNKLNPKIIVSSIIFSIDEKDNFLRPESDPESDPDRYLCFEHEIGADVGAVVDEDLELDPHKLGDGTGGQRPGVFKAHNLTIKYSIISII